MQNILYPQALSCSCVLGAVSGLWSSQRHRELHWGNLNCPRNSSDVKGSEPGKLFPMVYSTPVDSGCKKRS